MTDESSRKELLLHIKYRHKIFYEQKVISFNCEILSCNYLLFNDDDSAQTTATQSHYLPLLVVHSVVGWSQPLR